MDRPPATPPPTYQPPIGPPPAGTVAPPPSRPTNSMSIVSLAAGVASFVIVPFIGALVAIITGHMARGQIRRTGEDGRGLALAGLVLGYVNLVLCLLAVGAIVIVVVVVGLGLARSQPS